MPRAWLFTCGLMHTIWVTTASATRLPEQKERIHMIQMLRKEACSGQIEDIAHVASADCLSDCLTKASAKSNALVKALPTGVLKYMDMHPPFRTLPKHKAYPTQWLRSVFGPQAPFVSFFGEAPLSSVH